MVDHDRQPIDVLAEDVYPFPINLLGFERKAFAMLMPFTDREKIVVDGRPRQKLLRVSTNGAVYLVSPTAWEWERVMGFSIGDMNGSGRYEWERIEFLERCLDRNICTWLDSLLSTSHTPSIFPVPEHGKNSRPITNLGGGCVTTMLLGRYHPTYLRSICYYACSNLHACCTRYFLAIQ